MGKLHELLAVEDSLMTKFKVVLQEGVSTLSSKEHLFKGTTINQQSLLDKEDPKYHKYPDTTHTVPVQETVHNKLRYIFEDAARYFDAVAQKDATNREANADLIIDEKVILKNVPAITLLFLENKFKGIRSLIESVKTLDPAKVWSKTPGQDGVFQTPESAVAIEEPVQEFPIVAPATDKHPAQVKEVTKHVVRATKRTVEMSGLISPQEKSNLMSRCDKIINACKTARQRANDVATKDVQVSKELFEYLMK